MHNTIIKRASTEDVNDITVMVGELLHEIMATIGEAAFNFDQDATITRLHDLVAKEKYIVFWAQDERAKPLGFITLTESVALYAEGKFGTIPEFYVRPYARSQKLGSRLVEQAKQYALSQGWSRLEVTTPPLPVFDKTLGFYQREGFAITGGRKLKILL